MTLSSSYQQQQQQQPFSGETISLVVDRDVASARGRYPRYAYLLGAIAGAALLGAVYQSTTSTSSLSLASMNEADRVMSFPVDLEGNKKKKDEKKKDENKKDEEKKKKSHKKHHDDDNDEDEDDDDKPANNYSDNPPTTCENDYTKKTLKLAYELPFASLFRDAKGQKKFEASSVVIHDNFAYAVCDSSWAISKFDVNLQPFDETNIQIGDPNREEDDSAYEALFYDHGTFHVIRESVEDENEKFHAIIEQLAVGDTDYETVEICSTEFEFKGTLDVVFYLTMLLFGLLTIFLLPFLFLYHRHFQRLRRCHSGS
jgi:hypothetical protein